MKKTQLFNVVLIILVVISSILLWRVFFKKDAAPPMAKQAEDLIIDHVNLVKMNENGLPHYQLLSPQVKHHQGTYTTDIQSPDLSLFDAPKMPWRMVAKQGAATENFEQVLLTGNVVITQAVGPNNPANSVNTASLLVYPKRKFATTDQLVLMTQALQQLQGVGMQADFTSGVLTLLSKVKGDYETS